MSGPSAPDDGQGSSRRKYDLEERTARFGEDIIDFCRSVRMDPITSPLITQLVKASTSVGSNYGEADEAGSRKEFRYRISVCCRESKESNFWLRMMGKAAPERIEVSRQLWKEADELNRIFAAIFRKSDPDDD